MIVTITIFIFINLLLALIDSRLIGKKRKILHGFNALAYIGMLAIPYFSFHNYWLIAVLLFERLLIFNISLSLFRGLNWAYISPDPNAITDKIAKKIFSKNGKVMYSVYFLIFIAITIKCFL